MALLWFLGRGVKEEEIEIRTKLTVMLWEHESKEER
jgi:hypothetical protein